MVDDLDSIKSKLKSYSRGDIIFNEPHFTRQLILREGNKESVIHELLNPDHLVYFLTESGKRGDTVHVLHFKVSNTRTLRLPVIFDKRGKKCLYILTYIMRYRPWQNMVKKDKWDHK